MKWRRLTLPETIYRLWWKLLPSTSSLRLSRIWSMELAHSRGGGGGKAATGEEAAENKSKIIALSQRRETLSQFSISENGGTGRKKAEKNSNHVWERKREEEIVGGGGGNFSLAPHLGRSSCILPPPSPNFATAQKRENESSKWFPMKKKLCEAQYAWIERQKRVIKWHLCNEYWQEETVVSSFRCRSVGHTSHDFLAEDLCFLRTNIHFPLSPRSTSCWITFKAAALVGKRRKRERRGSRDFNSILLLPCFFPTKKKEEKKVSLTSPPRFFPFSSLLWRRRPSAHTPNVVGGPFWGELQGAPLISLHS